MADKAQLNYKTTKLGTDSRAHIFHAKDLLQTDSQLTKTHLKTLTLKQNNLRLMFIYSISRWTASVSWCF